MEKDTEQQNELQYEENITTQDHETNTDEQPIHDQATQEDTSEPVFLHSQTETWKETDFIEQHTADHHLIQDQQSETNETVQSETDANTFSRVSEDQSDTTVKETETFDQKQEAGTDTKAESVTHSHTEAEHFLPRHAKEADISSIQTDHERMETRESESEEFDYQKFHDELFQIVGNHEPSSDENIVSDWRLHPENHENIIDTQLTPSTEDENTTYSTEEEEVSQDTETYENLMQEEDPRKENDQSEDTNSEAEVTYIEDHTPWYLHQGWDYGLAALLLIMSCVFTYRLYKLSLLSFDLLWKVGLVLIIINLLMILLTLRTWKQWVIWVRRCFILILIAVFTYGSVFANTLQDSLEAITNPETATTVNISLITKRDGGSKQLSDLNDKKIGIQTANDKENSLFVKEQLEKESELDHVTYVEEIDYDSLYQQLMNDEIDALIITDYYFKTLLKESYPTIEDDIFILKSYQKQKETKVSSSTKDIQYEPFTVYIAGVDEGDDPSIDARSDVNIVLIVNPLANHIEMVSIPRDSFVPNPALGNANDKLTHLGLNGVENSMKGLEQVLGFEIDYYVKLNFFSVIEIIDAIGEIEVDVPISFCEQDENRSFAEEDLICLNEGKQKVNGKQALAFARHRKSYTDVMRGKAQQEVIKGTINVLTSPSGAMNINQVLKIAKKAVSTNMPMEQVTNFVSAQLDNLKPWTIDSIVLENGMDAHLVTASMPGQELYVMLLHPIDIQNVYESYQAMLSQMQFSKFTFHLDHLQDPVNELPYNPNILWAGSDVSSYQIPGTEETDSNEEETLPPDPKPEVPDVNAPDEETPPDESQNPTTPDIPEEPKPEEPKPEEPLPDTGQDNNENQGTE